MLGALLRSPALSLHPSSLTSVLHAPAAPQLCILWASGGFPLALLQPGISQGSRLGSCRSLLRFLSLRGHCPSIPGVQGPKTPSYVLSIVVVQVGVYLALDAPSWSGTEVCPLSFSLVDYFQSQPLTDLPCQLCKQRLCACERTMGPVRNAQTCDVFHTHISSRAVPLLATAC